MGHENLHTLDRSLHVTNGGVNPVPTIVALAYRFRWHFAETSGTAAEKEAPV